MFWALCALSVVGVILAGAGDGFTALLAALLDNVWVILFGIVSLVCWGMYSGFYCMVVRDVRDGLVAWLTIVSGAPAMGKPKQTAANRLWISFSAETSG